MTARMMALATEVIKRLYNADYAVLTEADMRVHIAIDLSRETGNQVAAFLGQLRFCASVELFVNQETAEINEIIVLVARNRKVYNREAARLRREFVARCQPRG